MSDFASLPDSHSRAEDHSRLLELLEAMDIAYFRANAEGITVFSNSIESRITGYTADELQGLPRSRFYAKDGDRDRLFAEAARNQDKTRGLLLKGRRKDGTFFWGECDIRVLRDPDTGVLLGTEGFYRDVSARIELQRFLNDDAEHLLSDEQLLEDFKADVEFHRDYLSSIGHQIQSPLGSVAGMLENLRNGMPSKTSLTDRLSWALGQTKACARLVKNLAYLDRLLRGERIEMKPVSFGRLAIETKLDFLHQIQAKKMELEIDDASLDRLLPRRGHPELLRQVFVNLIDNAIKYSLSRTKIRIRASSLPQGPSLEMTNRGLSVPANLREEIFRRRYRTPQAKAAVPDGTGIGLWLVRKIVEAHHAKVTCTEVIEDSEPRVLFRITFPSHPAHALTRRHP